MVIRARDELLRSNVQISESSSTRWKTRAARSRTASATVLPDSAGEAPETSDAVGRQDGLEETRRDACARPACRFCRAPLTRTFVDLGMSPLCESYVTADRLDEMEPFFPLHVWVCSRCFLVQLGEYVSPRRSFRNTPTSPPTRSPGCGTRRPTPTGWRSGSVSAPAAGSSRSPATTGTSCSTSWRAGFPSSASSRRRTWRRARSKRGFPTIERVLRTRSWRGSWRPTGRQADLIVGNNVLAHVPDLNDFVDGLRILLKPAGTITMEFPHLWRLMDENQFDTIYHEHFSYFSFLVAEQVFAAHELTVFDVEELPTHGGSLRIYARHAGDSSRPVTPAVETLQDPGEERGLREPRPL